MSRKLGLTQKKWFSYKNVYYASNNKILQMQAIDKLLQMSILNKEVSVFSRKKVLNMVLIII